MAVSYKYIEHWIPLQNKAEKEMLAEFEAGNYTLKNPLVKVNPYLLSPLSAVVLFKTEKPTAITVTVKGKTKAADMSHTYPVATTHILPVLGLYENYNNTVEIRPYRGTPTVLNIEIGDVKHAQMESIDTTPEYFQDNLMMITVSSIDPPTAFDYKGDCRWCLGAVCVFDVKPLKNGNLLVGTDRLIRMPYYMSGCYEMSPVGKIYKEYRIPGGYHHDAWEMEDGNLLILSEDLLSDTVEDHCVLIDRETGEVLRDIDYKNFLTHGDGKGLSFSDEDWFHNNALWYDKNTNSLTFSGRHVDAMVNIDYDTEELNWIIGDPNGWSEEKQKYFFKPIGNNFEWQYEQHACLITPNGDVMCFDNHHNATKFEGQEVAPKDSFSRGVRYRINTEDMTIEQVWEYGKSRGTDFYSPYICNVEFYNEGHYMVHSGGIATLPNGEPTAAIGSFARLQGGDLKSVTTEIYQDKKLYELRAKGNFYRARKVKIYDKAHLELGDGKILGSLQPTKEMDTEVPAEWTGEEMPATCNARIEDECDKFTFFAKFAKGDLVLLILENGEDKHQYWISTTAVPSKAMCAGTFLDSDERQTRTVITKTGYKGTYQVKCIINDKMYDCGTLDCE